MRVRDYLVATITSAVQPIGVRNKTMTAITQIPVVTLRDIVVYPHGVLPLFIGTAKSIAALEQAQEHDPDKRVLLLAKRDPENEDPGPSDLFESIPLFFRGKPIPVCCILKDYQHLVLRVDLH